MTRNPTKRKSNSTPRKKEAGQALIAAITALGIVLMGFAGLGIDVGYYRYEKRLQQTAADTAAVAGAAELSAGTELNPPCSNATEAAAASAAATNVATSNGFTTGTNNATVTVNTPPQSGPHTGAACYVEVYVSQIQPTFFMRVLGINNETVTARAVANGNGNASGCIYILGTSPTAINLSGGEQLTANDCGVIDDGGLEINNGATMTASSIGIAGPYSPGGGSAPNPAPTTGIVPAADPLSYLSPPTWCPSCGCITENTGTGTTVLSPTPPGGEPYCSITIGVAGGGATAVFNPGVYVITGNFDATNGATLTSNGNGVMFYQTAGTFTLGGQNGGGINLNLTPPATSDPSTGAVGGILFWQASGDTSNSTDGDPATIDNNTGNLTGGLYFPSAVLSFQGGVSAAPYSVVVAKGLTIANGVRLTINGNSFPQSGGSPIKSAQLVE